MRKSRAVRSRCKRGTALEEVRARKGGVLIPVPGHNRFGMECGYYDHAELVELLRDHKTNPEAIQFIADMME